MLKDKVSVVFIGLLESQHSHYFLNKLCENDKIILKKIIFKSIIQEFNEKRLLAKCKFVLNNFSLFKIINFFFNNIKSKKKERFIFNSTIIKNQNEIYNLLKNLNFDYIIVCSFNEKINQKILSIPKYKSLNVHANDIELLRGQFPIENVILSKIIKNAVTVHEMSHIFDHGKIIYKSEHLVKDCYLKQHIENKIFNSYSEICKNLHHILLNDIKYDAGFLPQKGYNIKINFFQKHFMFIKLILNYLLFRIS